MGCYNSTALREPTASGLDFSPVLEYAAVWSSKPTSVSSCRSSVISLFTNGDSGFVYQKERLLRLVRLSLEHLPSALRSSHDGDGMRSKCLSAHSLLIVLALFLGGASFMACGMNVNFDGIVEDAYPCDDPKYSDYHADICVDWRCESGNAIPEDNCPDAGSSSSSSGSSARCVGACVPNAPNGFEDPQPVYIGPGKAKYVFGCPAELGSFGAPNQYNDLHVPSPGCPSCVCGSIKGSCAPPATITLRASTCDTQPSDTFNFSGPDGWDGSCTNVNAMPAGAECPPGSGISCAQSIDAATLAPPVETCEPIPLPVPKATSDKPWWTNTVMSCSPSVLSGLCDKAAAETCLPSLPADEPEWRYCVRKVGIHECPQGDGATFVKQYVAYDGYMDTRKCTECECGASGGACYGTLRAYKDDACSTNELNSYVVGSNMTNCLNLPPSGDAFGSKEFTDLTYVPGSCEPKGGEPLGDVVPIKTKVTPAGDVVETVTTWCCADNESEKSESQ